MANNVGKILAFISFLFIFENSSSAQVLPQAISHYLDRNFRGWKLAGECTEPGNKRVIAGDFDGNKKRDYALKFVRGNKGFMMAFLATNNKYRPFYLHIYSRDEAKYSDLKLYKKGYSYEVNEERFRLKHDSPADFDCESDFGGVHTYLNGKFIAY